MTLKQTLIARKTMKKRIEWIDLLKGFAILMVVLSHCLYGDNMSGFLRTLCLWLFSFYMQLFFSVSGYFFSYKKTYDYSAVIKKRFRSLMIPYFFWGILIGLSVSYIPNILRGNYPDFGKLLYRITTFQESSSAGWFLQVLFFIYLLEYGLCAAGSKYNPVRNKAVLCFLHLLMAFFAVFLSDKPIGNFMRLSRILKYSLYFYLGTQINRIIHPESKPTIQTLFYSVLLLSVSFLTYLLQSDHSLFSQIIEILISVSGIFGLYYFFQWISYSSFKNSIPAKVLSSFGFNSITVLCTHQLLIIIIHKVEHLIGLYQNETYPLFLTFLLVLLAEIPLVTYHFHLFELSLGKGHE